MHIIFEVQKNNMKKTLLIFALTLGSVTAFSQSSVGLIAHWDMNGTVNDVSGNGHNGHGSNITPDTGQYGMPNTAYYFNGINSIITAPYGPNLNVTQLSICATVKVKGFYSGNCQDNLVIMRGDRLTTGSYVLDFSDNSLGGSSYCSVYDTTGDVFGIACGTNTAPTITALAYSPTITENQWYNFVGTFDGLTFNIYINGVLKNTYVSTGAMVGTSTDSIAIGYDLFEASLGYPNQFKGLIDDIRLYNRVLNDSEVLHYGDTCGKITLQPTPSAIIEGHNTVFIVNSSILYAGYQWQQDAGTGFVNLSNSGPYSGVTTPTLTITGASTALNSTQYRCVIANSWVCSDTSTSALLSVNSSAEVNHVVTNDMIIVYPNPANSTLSVQLSANYNSGFIQLINEVGQVLLQQNLNNKSV